MTQDTKRVATSYYFCSIEHKEVSGIFMGSFALAGEAPQWVTGADGKPRQFRDSLQAEINAARVLLSKINRAHDPQKFTTKRDAKRNSIVSFRPTERPTKDLTVEDVFGKR
jgi:hypothetical protein